jgi:protease IV
MSETKISFGKIFWPSFLAVFIAGFVGMIFFFLVLGGIIGSFSSFGPKPLSLEDKTILHVQLNGEIREKGKSEFDPNTFDVVEAIGLPDILYSLEKAKKDDKIKGVFLDMGNISCGMATAREIRKALKDFKKSGKFVIAYNSGEYVSQKSYYVSSVATESYGFPMSNFQWTGLGGELTFFKGMLDKLEVEVEIIRGSNNDFKSAVEPFFRKNMSDSSKHQMQRYITSMWEEMRNDIALDRKVSADQLNNLAENLSIHNVEDAVSFKLLDGTKYRDEMMAYLMKKVKVEKEEDLALQAFEKYAKKTFYQDQILIKAKKPDVAVILAEGDVSRDGDGLTSQQICKLFKKVRNDKDIKTVVFRINSPGGSALASEEIWREVDMTNKVKKVIVSMGDVAASGGYYIAAPADKIFAEPTTITGSIGVFGMIPYTGKMLENKLGLTFDRVSTNKHAVLSTNRKLTKEELDITQKEVDDIYFQFLKRVADGRKMSTEQVNAVARGRVWTGRDALAIGLVDQLGGLSDAIAYATNQAKLKDPKVIYYPLKKEDKLGDLFEMINGDEDDGDDDAALKMKNLGLPKELLVQYEQLKKLEGMKGIQMRLPFELRVD